MPEPEANLQRPGPRWLEPRENPFGIKVLDCRGSYYHKESLLHDKEYMALRAKRLLSDGKEFRVASMHFGLAVLCHLEYPVAGDGPLPEGPLFIPQKDDDTWFIYHFDGQMIFVHWPQREGDYRARVRREPNRIVIDYINCLERYAGLGSLYYTRVVDFLIKSHLYNRAVPHPLPDQPRDGTDEFYLELAYFEYGCRGLFGTFEDTLQLPWLDVDTRALTRVESNQPTEGGDDRPA